MYVYYLQIKFLFISLKKKIAPGHSTFIKILIERIVIKIRRGYNIFHTVLNIFVNFK